VVVVVSSVQPTEEIEASRSEQSARWLRLMGVVVSHEKRTRQPFLYERSAAFRPRIANAVSSRGDSPRTNSGQARQRTRSQPPRGREREPHAQRSTGIRDALQGADRERSVRWPRSCRSSSTRTRVAFGRTALGFACVDVARTHAVAVGSRRSWQLSITGVSRRKQTRSKGIIDRGRGKQLPLPHCGSRSGSRSTNVYQRCCYERKKFVDCGPNASGRGWFVRCGQNARA